MTQHAAVKWTIIVGAVLCGTFGLVFFANYINTIQDSQIRAALQRGDRSVAAFVGSCMQSIDDMERCKASCNHLFDDEGPAYKWQICHYTVLRHSRRLSSSPE